MKIIVILHNIRSTYNVGAVLRTAEGLGVEKIIYSGYTPRYEDERVLPHLREKLNRQIAKSALGAERLVTQESVDGDLLEQWLERAARDGYKLVGLENNLTQEEMKRQKILGEPAKLGDKAVLLLGEEVGGIPTTLREKMELFLEIPMHGQKESLNVSVAAGIALWGLTTLY